MAAPAWLVRAVLALYPPGVRARYGAEIDELLAHSPTPGRDLADVARCALTDRLAASAAPHGRRQLVRYAGLLAAPAALGLALLTFAFLGLLAMGLAELAGIRISDGLGRYVMAAAVLPGGVAAIWLADRLADRMRVGAPGLVVPTVLALGIVAAGSLPYVGEGLGEARWPVLVGAVGCWWAATVATACGGGALLRRGRRRAAAAVMVLGGLAAAELACAGYVLLVLDVLTVPGWSAAAAYPTALTAADPALAGDPAGEMAEWLKGLPAMLTVCAVFVAMFVAVTAGRPRAHPTPDPGSPGTAT